MRRKTATQKSSRKQRQPHHNSAAAQRKCVIEALRAFPEGLTTIELREKFDVMMPAARVHELRWRHFYNIKTISVTDTNAQGNTIVSRVTFFVVASGGAHERNYSDGVRAW